MKNGKSIAGLDFPDEDGFRKINDRLKKITGASTDRAMFEALGLKPHSAYAAVKKQQVQPSWIVGAVTMYGASANWIIYGGDDTDIQMIPVVELRVDRRNQTKIVKTLGELPYKRDWLEAKGGIDNLLMVRAVGDSMEPTIFENSLVLINTSLRTPHPGAIYAMAFNQHWHLKRLHTQPGRLVMQSDNKHYPDIEVDFAGGHLPGDVKVIGRAVCWQTEENI